ncbi:KilA-N domain-containing protein [Methylococcus sp. EFPC2]|uniref:KilA-N domain-containing protein n=1 Tax=Methylococcus sp. EFPC2 TaxID=2812648 RepID=UPI00196723C9|nr:KilA-N domain-containing protein [Methylococcus sp. EFPC2]QSA97736.1 KilA-N domain-containing protein [Methylococcus sp. EFPC2]
MTIANTAIRQDPDGRFSLNDLHRASGGEKRHGASYWLSNQQTKELMAELETTGIPVVSVEGRNGGTYVCKELVYAYAMWISPKFHLQVIRAYDAMVTGVPAHVTRLQLLEIALQAERERMALEQRVETLSAQVEALTAPTMPNPPGKRLYTVRQAAEAYPAFSAASLRNLIFNAAPRKSSRGTLPGNGLSESGALVRIGRRVLLDADGFEAWLSQHRTPV